MILKLLATAAGYLLGSIPVSYLVVRLTKKTDVRAHGSGNVGATNVLRVAGKLPALAALVGDALKGVLAVTWLAAAFGVSRMSRPAEGLALLALAVVGGHIWPVFLKFKGGKGVATTLGVYLGLAWPAFLWSAGIWVLLLLLSRRVSVGSLGLAFTAPVYFAVTGRTGGNVPGVYLALSLILGLLIVVGHRGNIERLLAGKENKIF